MLLGKWEGDDSTVDFIVHASIRLQSFSHQYFLRCACLEMPPPFHAENDCRNKQMADIAM